MKTIMKRFGMLLAATLAAGAANSQADDAPAPTAPVAAVMVSSDFSTNINEVLKLTQAGLGDDVVVAFVKNAQAPYDLKARDILALKKIGLSQTVLAAMLSHDAAMKQAAYPSGNNPAVPEAVTAEAAVPPAAPVGTPQAVASPTVAPNTVVTPAPQVVVVQPPAPPPQIEIIPIAPGPDYYWCDGYWAWRGRSYVWVGGYWGPRPYYRGGVYVGGHWGGPGWRGPGPGHYGPGPRGFGPHR